LVLTDIEPELYPAEQLVRIGDPLPVTELLTGSPSPD
jgi:hypothetical protein